MAKFEGNTVYLQKYSQQQSFEHHMDANIGTQAGSFHRAKPLSVVKPSIALAIPFLHLSQMSL